MKNKDSLEFTSYLSETEESLAGSIAAAGVLNQINARKFERDVISDLSSDILGHVDVNAEQISLILQSDIHLEAFKEIVRYNDTEWDVDRPSDELVVLLRRILNQPGSSSIYPNTIVESDVIEIRATDTRLTDSMERVDVIEKYGLFRQELNDVASTAGNRFSNPAVLEDIAIALNEDVEVILQKCTVDMLEPELLGSIECINKQTLVGQLETVHETINSRLASGNIDIDTYAEIFPILSRHKKLHANLRKLAFALTFQRRLPLQSMFTKLPEQPNINAIEQIDYFINEEVVGNIFKDVFTQDHVAQKFKRMCKTGPISMDMHKDKESSIMESTRKIQFIPTRGALREFAAYIGDSCYTLQGKLMSEEHPNVTAIIMKQINRGTGEERFVGSSLLIDTTDVSGDRVAVIRALNPIENIINKLSVSDFYNQFINYIKAATQGDFSKVGIVIDNRAGGAATNRPLLFNYLKRLRDDGILRPMTMIGKEDTVINGFDISDKVYEV